MKMVIYVLLRSEKNYNTSKNKPICEMDIINTSTPMHYHSSCRLIEQS